MKIVGADVLFGILVERKYSFWSLMKKVVRAEQRNRGRIQNFGFMVPEHEGLNAQEGTPCSSFPNFSVC